MKKERMLTIEEEKKELTEAYNEAMYELYKVEIQEAIDWFHAKYPKRTIQWRSGMGTCFWIMDEEILHWNTLDVKHSSGMWEQWYVDAVPDRRAQRLLPLWNVFQSIHDNTNVLGYGVPSQDTE